VLSRLQGCGLLPDDPRIQEALAGLTATEEASQQISFGQFKELAKHNSSLIQRGDLTEVRALVAGGVDPGTADYDGRTPLHLAAAEGQSEVVGYLLALGADPQSIDRWGGTPLSDAEGNGHTHVAELLRQAVRDTPEAVAV
jgi:ankyrin repeat protein